MPIWFLNISKDVGKTGYRFSTSQLISMNGLQGLVYIMNTKKEVVV